MLLIQEPLSPELEHAAAENSATSIPNNDSTVPSLQTATSKAMPSRSTLQTVDDEPNSIAEVDSKTCSQPQKYSLFQAMINSKRVKTTAPHQSPSTAPLQPSSSEQENARESSSALEHSVERSFDALAELVVEPSDGNSGSLSNSVLNSDGQNVLPFSAECLNNTALTASTEMHNTCFEDLGDIDIEDSTCLEPLVHDGQVNLEGNIRPRDDDSVGSTTEMDWEETNEDFEDVFDEFSDFFTSSETSSECGDREGTVGQPEVELVLDMERECQAPDPTKQTMINRALSPAVCCTQDSLQQNSLGFINPIPNSVSMLVAINKLPTSVTSTDAIATGNTTGSELHCTSYPATDDDWVQLGELDVVEMSTVQQAPMKSTVAEQPRPETFDGNLRQTLTVPDLSQCSFTTDIDEDDFHWD